jgi:hypothetical protein
MDYKPGNCLTVERFYVSEMGRGGYLHTKFDVTTIIVVPQRSASKISV